MRGKEKTKEGEIIQMLCLFLVLTFPRINPHWVVSLPVYLSPSFEKEADGWVVWLLLQGKSSMPKKKIITLRMHKDEKGGDQKKFLQTRWWTCLLGGRSLHGGTGMIRQWKTRSWESTKTWHKISNMFSNRLHRSLAKCFKLEIWERNEHSEFAVVGGGKQQSNVKMNTKAREKRREKEISKSKYLKNVLHLLDLRKPARDDIRQRKEE